MGPPHSFLALLPALTLLVLLIWTPLASGAVTNTTVDDADSSFTFSGSWTAVSPSNPCSFCSSKPDSTLTVDQTWHDGNYRTGASETTTGSFTFTGSAVYIFGIDQAESQPDIAFTLGNTQAVHHYTGTEQFVYNALFFSATGLAADESHTVNWIFNIDPSTGVGVQAALFDYAIVTSGSDDEVAPVGTISKSTTSSIASITTQSSLGSTPSTKTRAPSSSPANLVSQSSHSSSTSLSSGTSSTILPSTPISNSKQTALSSPASSALSTSPSQTAALSSSSASHSTNNLSAILGGLFGALALVVLALVAFLMCRRRRRRARADEERLAAGLAPAPPRMRRIRGNNMLHPFVDDSPPAAPTGNVFATGAFATAASAGAGVSGSAAAPGARYPFKSAGYTFAGPGGVVPRDDSQMSRSDTMLSPTSPVDKAEADQLQATAASGSAVAPSAREHYLEQRLASLEAHFASHVPPPPYEGASSNSAGPPPPAQTSQVL